MKDEKERIEKWEVENIKVEVKQKSDTGIFEVKISDTFDGVTKFDFGTSGLIWVPSKSTVKKSACPGMKKIFVIESDKK